MRFGFLHCIVTEGGTVSTFTEVTSYTVKKPIACTHSRNLLIDNHDSGYLGMAVQLYV